MLPKGGFFILDYLNNLKSKCCKNTYLIFLGRKMENHYNPAFTGDLSEWGDLNQVRIGR